MGIGMRRGQHCKTLSPRIAMPNLKTRTFKVKDVMDELFSSDLLKSILLGQ